MQYDTFYAPGRSNQSLLTSFYHLDRRRKRGVMELDIAVSPLVGVRKESVIGVYLDNSVHVPLPAIGTKSESSLNGVLIGACVTSTSNSTSTLTCNGSNQPHYVIQAEADICKSNV